MILTGEGIAQAVASGRIVFDPFSNSKLNPNSIDIHLDGRLRVFDASVANATSASEETSLPESGYVLKPGYLYLAQSQERFGSRCFVPIVHGKSNIARAGLFVHINGEMIDLGVVDQFQFQLAPMLPIRVLPGMAIGQVSFWSVFEMSNDGEPKPPP